MNIDAYLNDSKESQLMDGMVRKNKFQEYITRLDRAREEIQNQNTNHPFQEQVDSISSFLNDHQDANEYNIAKGLLTAAILTVTTFGYIKYGHVFRYLPAFVMVAAFFLYFRITIKSAHAKMKLHEGSSLEDQDVQSRVLTQLNYLRTLANIKISRVEMVRIFFAIMFPILLFYLKDVLYAADNHLILSGALALVMGAGFWWFFFKRDKDKLEKVNSDIDQIEAEILRASQG